MSSLSKRTRRIVAAASAAAVVALGIPLGVGVASAAQTQPTRVAPVDNPKGANSCGLDVVLVLDASGSIGQYNATNDVKNAANAFLSGLANTNTRVGIVKFSTTATAVVPEEYVTTASTSTGGDHAKAIAGYSSSGSTNWQDGLLKAQGEFSAASSRNVPKLVVFVTDGAPNTTNKSGGGTTSWTDAATGAVDPAVTVMNQIKGTGTHALVVGVGQALPHAADPSNPLIDALYRVSQYPTPDIYEPPTHPTFDATSTDLILDNDYSGLSADLSTVATNLCKGSLTIQKLASTPSAPNTYAPASGWTFTATPSAAAKTYSWVQPSTSAAASKDDVTDINGTATFQWNVTNPSDWTSGIAVQEHTTTGFTMQTPVCTNGGQSVPVTNFDPVKGTFNVNVGPTDAVSCTVKNQASSVIDLSLTKAVTSPATGPYLVDAPLTYTVTAKNSGPSDATGVVVKDSLPANFTSLSAVAPAGTTFNTTTGVWTIGALASGASKSLTITGTPTQVGTLRNVAEVTAADQPDSDSTPNNCNDGANLEDDCAVVTTQIQRLYTLNIAKTICDCTTNPTVGSTVKYDLDVSNAGPSVAPTGFFVKDTLPDGLNVVGASSLDTNWACTWSTSSQLVTCTWGGAPLAVNAHAPEIVITAVVGTALANAQSVTNEGCVYKVGARESDNCSSVNLPLNPSYDLSLTKWDSGDATVPVGGTAQWSFNVTNHGPSNASNFPVHDTLPAGLTNVAVNPGANWNCPTVTNTSIDCTYTGTLLNGHTTSNVVITATISNSLADTSSVTNKACVKDTFKDDSNDCSTATVNITPVTDLSITKTQSENTPNPVAVGSPVDYIITVTNAGPSSATGFEIQDPVPAGLDAVSASGTGFSCTVDSSNKVVCDYTGAPIGPLDSSSTATITVSATVGPTLLNSPDGVINEACVYNGGQTTEPTQTEDLATANLVAFTGINAESTAPVDMKPVDCDSVHTTTPTGTLSIVKTNDPDGDTTIDGFGPANPITYTLDVTANGQLAENDVTVTDYVPGYDPADSTSAVATYVAASAACVSPQTSTTCTVTPTVNGSGNTTMLTWDLGTLAAGQSQSVTFKVYIGTQQAPAEGPSPSTVTADNTGYVTSDENGDGAPSNTVHNTVNVVTAIPNTASSCVSDTPYFGFVSTGWFAGETVHLHILDNTQAPYEVRDVTADSSGVVTAKELWPGFSVNPVTNVKTYPGLNLRPIYFYLQGSPTTPTVEVAYPGVAEKCDPGMTITKTNTPEGTVNFGDTISYDLKVHVADNAAFNQDGVVVTDYIPGYDPAAPTSGTTTYVNHSAACVGTLLPTVGTCQITFTKNSAGKVTKLTWHLGSMKPGQTLDVVFKVTADTQSAASSTATTIPLLNAAAVSSDYWPTTNSNQVTNTLDTSAVLGETIPNETLPHTGADVLNVLRWALALLGAGTIALSMSRRRRSAE